MCNALSLCHMRTQRQGTGKQVQWQELWHIDSNDRRIQDDLAEKIEWKVLWGGELKKVSDWLGRVKWLKEREPGRQVGRHPHTLRRGRRCVLKLLVDRSSIPLWPRKVSISERTWDDAMLKDNQTDMLLCWKCLCYWADLLQLIKYSRHYHNTTSLTNKSNNSAVKLLPLSGFYCVWFITLMNWLDVMKEP